MVENTAFDVNGADGKGVVMFSEVMVSFVSQRNGMEKGKAIESVYFFLTKLKHLNRPILIKEVAQVVAWHSAENGNY